MQCPYCSRDMEDGYIQSARHFYFTRKLHKFMIFPCEGDTTLSTHNLTAPRCEAHRCRDCKKVILRYEDD